MLRPSGRASRGIPHTPFIAPLDVTVSVLLGGLGFILARSFNLYERLDRFSQARGFTQLDETFFFLAAMATVLVVFSLRRWHACKDEAIQRAASEERLSALFNASPVPVGVFSLDDGAIIDANDLAIRAAGRPREDIIGRSIRDLGFWDVAVADKLLDELRRNGNVRDFEIQTRIGNVARDALVSARSVYIGGQRCFIAAMSDISAQRAAERARAATDAELHGVFLAMRDLVLVLSRDGEYLKVPETNNDLLYEPSRQLIGRRVHEVLPTADADAVCAVIRRSLDGRQAVATEYPLHINGKKIWFSALVTPLAGDSVVWVARDITHERESREKLAESEARYRLLFERNPQPMWVLGAGHRFLDVNDAAIRHYGYSRDEFLLLSAEQIRPAEDVGLFRDARELQWPLDEKRLFRHKKKNGDVIDVEISRDDITFRGQPARLVLAHDVTARLDAARKLEQSLERAEYEIQHRKLITDRFESAFGNAPIGMILQDADGRWAQVNRAMCELLGRPASELVGQRSDDITHPDDVATTHDAHAHLRAGLGSVRFEKRYRHCNGREVLTVVNATMVKDDGDGLIISHVLDITDQRVAEAQLRRQALVFEILGEAVVITEPNGRILDANGAVTTILGYSRDEVLGQTPRLWQRNDDDGATFKVISKGLEQDGLWSGEYAYVAKDGRGGVVESTVRTLRDAHGRPLNNIGVMRDVTEQRELQRHLLQAQKLEAIGSLAAGIAHEINTPTQYVGDNVRFLGEGIAALGGVLNEARALAAAAKSHDALTAAADAFNEKAFEVDIDYLLAELPLAAEQSREGCDRISDIVKAMKGFSHPGAAVKQLVDLNGAVRDTLTVCRNEWKYVATLETAFDENMPLVPCLQGDLQQVVLNLVVNAAQAVAEARAGSSELGNIRVATRYDGDWAEIIVQDDGCGIPEAIRGKVFDPFFTTKKVGTGSGQGLSIGHATIVGKHKGTLTFDSEVGKGTTFRIRLPLDNADDLGAVA